PTHPSSVKERNANFPPHDRILVVGASNKLAGSCPKPAHEFTRANALAGSIPECPDSIHSNAGCAGFSKRGVRNRPSARATSDANGGRESLKPDGRAESQAATDPSGPKSTNG